MANDDTGWTQVKPPAYAGPVTLLKGGLYSFGGNTFNIEAELQNIRHKTATLNSARGNELYVEDGQNYWRAKYEDNLWFTKQSAQPTANSKSPKPTKEKASAPSFDPNGLNLPWIKISPTFWLKPINKSKVTTYELQKFDVSILEAAREFVAAYRYAEIPATIGVSKNVGIHENLVSLDVLEPICYDGWNHVCVVFKKIGRITHVAVRERSVYWCSWSTIFKRFIVRAAVSLLFLIFVLSCAPESWAILRAQERFSRGSFATMPEVFACVALGAFDGIYSLWIIARIGKLHLLRRMKYPLLALFFAAYSFFAVIVFLPVALVQHWVPPGVFFALGVGSFLFCWNFIQSALPIIYPNGVDEWDDTTSGIGRAVRAVLVGNAAED